MNGDTKSDKYGSTSAFPKHWDDSTFYPLDWLHHQMAWSIFLYAHVVFLIQTADQLLIGVGSWCVDRWDLLIKKVKKKKKNQTPINKTQDIAL